MTDSPDEDLEQRGRAIFDRLRSRVVGPSPAPDAEEPARADEEAGPPAQVLVEDPVAAPPDEGPVPAAGAAADPAAEAPAGAEAPRAPESTPDDESPHDASEGEADAHAGAAAASTVDVPTAVEPNGVHTTWDPALLDAAEVVRGAEVRAAAAVTAPTDSTPFARDLPRVVAIANQKGGVGKTTTAINLSACLAELGYRVLVVDLDPQGNATTGLGINPRNLSGSMYDVLLNDRGLDDVVEATSVRNLFVAPSSLDLAGAEIELVPAFSRELKLRRAVEDVLDDFDFVVVDCPPSLGLLTVNGLAAAHEVLVPIQCEYYALEGLGQLLRNVTMVQQNLNPRLEVSAIVLVMYDARTKLAGEVVSEVRGYFGEKVCRTVVPRTVRLSEAPSFGQPINAFDPSSRGAIAYRALAKEFSGGTPHRVG